MQQNRAERVEVNFPIAYTAEDVKDSEITGDCINISESGLLGEFDQVLELWTEGEIVLRFWEGALGLKARVARVEGKQAGMVFRFENEEQRCTVAEVVASAASAMKQKGQRPAVPF